MENNITTEKTTNAPDRRSNEPLPEPLIEPSGEHSPDECHQRVAHHPEHLKIEMIQRLRRIEGQVRGIARMIDENHYCDDILHQILSVESALSGVKKSLLKAHIKGCVADQLKNGSDEVIEELMVTMTKMMK